MPIEIPDPIVPGIESTSYSTLEEANSYFNSRLHVGVWTSASNDDKQRALNDAARIIDRFQYLGSKLEATQIHEWPRSGVSLNCVAVEDVPGDIKLAEFEIAIALLSGIDPERELRSLMVTSRGYSSVRITYDPKRFPEWLTYGVPSGVAWAYLSPYLIRNPANLITLHRVS